MDDKIKLFFHFLCPENFKLIYQTKKCSIFHYVKCTANCMKKNCMCGTFFKAFGVLKFCKVFMD